MKLEITAIIDTVGPIKPLTKGFQQFIILRIPEKKDEFETVVRKEQYFRVEVYSTSQTDSRFLDSRSLRAKTKAVCYLNGERWVNDATKEFNYQNKLKLADWQKPNQ